MQGDRHLGHTLELGGHQLGFRCRFLRDDRHRLHRFGDLSGGIPLGDRCFGNRPQNFIDLFTNERHILERGFGFADKFGSRDNLSCTGFHHLHHLDSLLLGVVQSPARSW